jgi:hypothetical protein
MPLKKAKINKIEMEGGRHIYVCLDIKDENGGVLISYIAKLYSTEDIIKNIITTNFECLKYRNNQVRKKLKPKRK